MLPSRPIGRPDSQSKVFAQPAMGVHCMTVPGFNLSAQIGINSKAGKGMYLHLYVLFLELLHKLGFGSLPLAGIHNFQSSCSLLKLLLTLAQQMLPENGTNKVS